MEIFLLAIYIGLIFIRPMEWYPALRDLPLVNGTAIATLVISFPKIMATLRQTWTSVPQVKVMLALLFAVMFSWVPSFWFGGIQWGFQDFGKLLILFMLIVFLPQKMRTLNVLRWTVLLCIGWLAVHGMIQHATGTGFGGLAPFWRRSHWDEEVFIDQITAFGIFNDPNDLCLAFILAMPLAWAELRASANVVAKGASLVLIGMYGYGAYLTNSRGGFVGLFGMIVAFSIARMSGFKRWLMVSGSVLLITVVAPSRITAKTGIEMGRVNNWGDGIEAFKSHPLFGTGYGTFPDICEEHQVAHNSYIHILTELGLLGYVCFFLLIFLTMVHLRRTMTLGPQLDHDERLHLSALFSSLVGYLTSIYFLSRQYNPVLYIMLGLAVSQVLVIARRHNLYSEIFGNYRADLKRGVKWAFGSVVFLYITVRIANLSR